MNQAGIGAITGSVIGYLLEHGRCDRSASRCTSAHGAFSGAALGVLAGSAIGHLFTSRSACMPASAQSSNMIHTMRQLVGSASDDSVMRQRWRIQPVPRVEVYLVTDERTCRRARFALDSLIHAGNPRAVGLKHIPSVYVVRAGPVVDVEIPENSSGPDIFDAKSWRFLDHIVYE